MYFSFGASEGVFESPSTLVFDAVAMFDAISILDNQREQEEYVRAVGANSGEYIEGNRCFAIQVLYLENSVIISASHKNP
jgi:hypothetical protein